jgi:ankyrin repeat protein
MKQLFDAIRAGDLEGVKAQLDADASLVNAKNEQGVSAIAFSIYNRKPEITALLEERGVSHDIFTAVMAGKTDLVAEMLSGNKGLVRLMSADGWTPLHLAAFFSQTECAAILLGSGAEVTTRSTNPMQNMPLHAAVAGRNTEIVSMLVEAGAPVNARQHGGWAPLHAAAQNGDVEIAEILLGKGAEVGARADNNQAAFDLALSKGHQAMVDLLEKHGVRF